MADDYEQAVKLFRSTLEHTGEASNSISNRIVFKRFWIASAVFARMCLLSKSITILIDEYPKRHSTIDHCAIGILVRAILEHHILIEYVCESGISRSEWQLRKWTFDIHDIVSRVRLHKGIGNEDNYRDAKNVIPQFIDRFKSNELFGSLPNEVKEEILKGQRIYVHGLRKAVRYAGWDPKEWDGIYNYLSGQGHSSPIGYYYYTEQGVDHLSIAEYQRGYISLVLQLATDALSRSTEKVKILFSNSDEDYPTDE